MKKKQNYSGLFKPISNCNKFFLTMKISAFFLFFSLVNVIAAPGYSQATKISLDIKDATIEDVLSKIEDVSEFYFLYNQKLVDVSRKVSIEANQDPIAEILKDIFPVDVKFAVYDRQIILTPVNQSVSISELPQQQFVTGVVTDKNGAPLAGVNVVVTGTTLGTMTDILGKYSIEVPRGSRSLTFSFIGMVPQEILIGASATIDVALSEDAIGLSEVVVVGYGTQKKKDLTGSISSVKVDAYKSQPVLSASSALRGRVSGMQVTNTSGAPGGQVKIRIRGANSINASNEPLYVIDGIALSSIGLKDININDIESMEILKDASATSIYGSRGANGVVLLTTKSGKTGESKIDYTGFMSINSPMYKYDLLDAQEYAVLANHIAGSAAFANPADFAGKSTDWQDLIFQKGVTNSHQLSASGGNERSRYYISGNYIENVGLLKNTKQDRFSLKSNIDSKISKRATLNLGLMASRTNSTNNTDNGGKGNPVTGSLAWAPTEEVYDSPGVYNRNAVSPIWTNPLMNLLERKGDRFTNSALINSKLNYRFTDYLTLDVILGMNLESSRGASLSNQILNPGNPTAGQNQSESYTLQNSNILTFHKVFGEKHDLTVVALEESSSNTYNYFAANGTGLSSTSNEYYNLGLNKVQSISSAYSNWALLSYVGRFSYSFDSKYLITATFRADGSSKFQTTSNKWGYFPSVGLGWRLSEEEFIKNLNIFSNLKLRGSYGVTGSQAIAPYSSLGLLSPVQYSFGTTTLVQGYKQGSPANPDLTWETTNQTDLGMDMGFWDDRLIVSFDYYSKKTKDLLLYTPIAGYNGGGTTLKNLGVVTNKGVEFSVEVVPVETESITWTTTLNASVNRNEVVSLGKDSVIFRSEFVGGGVVNTNIQMVKVGESLGAFYLIPWLGVATEDNAALGTKAGDDSYEDVNKDGSIDFDDRVISGSAMPKMMLSWNNTVRYRNMELNMFIQSSIGNKIFNAAYAMISKPNSDVRYPTLADAADYWTTSNKGSVWSDPGSDTYRNFTESTQYLQDGSYVRLKNLSLTYNVPKSILSSVDASLSLSAQNLLTITKYKGFDPEATSTSVDSDASAGIDFGAYPSPRTITIGLHLGF